MLLPALSFSMVIPRFVPAKTRLAVPRAVKGDGEYLATLASEGKTPVGGKSAAGEAWHKKENCGKPEHANAPDDCSCIDSKD